MISACKVVRWRVLTPSILFVKKVGQCFSRSGTVAEFLDETGVSLFMGGLPPTIAEGMMPESILQWKGRA